MNRVQALEMASRIESWLLDSCIQIPDGPQRGGVAGWLDWLGKPAFVYPEITGYYLTWLAFLKIASPDQLDRIRSRAGAALGWLASWLESDRLPPTRIYLLPETEDWRNRVTFSFDLAMLWRGVRAARMAHFIEAAN